MDFSDSTKAVFNRIKMLEPEHVTKIIGYLLLQDHGGREMIRLAFGPDKLIHSLISKAKDELGLTSRPVISTPISHASVNSGPISQLPLEFTPFTPASPLPFSSPTSLHFPSPYWEPQVPSDGQPIQKLDFVPPSAYTDSLKEDYHHHQPQFVSIEDHLDAVNSAHPTFSSSFYYPEHTSSSVLNARASRRSPSLPDFPLKICHYFNKGYCKHGSNCRYFHGQTVLDNSQFLELSPDELSGEDHVFLPGSLENLEMELVELLKSRRGMPVSIASLPMLYFEKYGRNLQANGYLTESQRHGKVGYSLTKLLARLHTIRLIDRPHGQHSVVLAEDAARYMDYRSERGDSGSIAAESRQIYLTFPPESTFSEEDVSEYFKIFGPVQDVRIPSQQKRMFGFVTFVYPETVKLILMKGNPHFVCGARILVKPYREKSRLIDRKYQEKSNLPMYYQPHFLDMDPHFLSIRDNSRLLGKQLIEEHEQAIELERRRLSEMQLTPKTPTQQPYFSYPSLEELKLAACSEYGEFPSTNRFNHLLDVVNNNSIGDDIVRHTNNHYNEQESQGITLPESPFASSMASHSSTV